MLIVAIIATGTAIVGVCPGYGYRYYGGYPAWGYAYGYPIATTTATTTVTTTFTITPVIITMGISTEAEAFGSAAG